MKSIIIHRYQEISSLFMLSILSILLLSVRMKITHDFYMLFLVWNLFLALLSYAISLWYTGMVLPYINKKQARWLFIPVFVIWLLIFPNAPYIITDLIHLRNSSGSWLIYDAVLISSFAITGCWAGFKSMQQMVPAITRLNFISNNNLLTVTENAILFLTALGIYLGRDLRWNSWDIIQHPDQLIIDTLVIFIHPLSHQTAWLQIIPMSAFLMVFYRLFKNYEKKS